MHRKIPSRLSQEDDDVDFGLEASGFYSTSDTGVDLGTETSSPTAEPSKSAVNEIYSASYSTDPMSSATSSRVATWQQYVSSITPQSTGSSPSAPATFSAPVFSSVASQIPAGANQAAAAAAASASASVKAGPSSGLPTPALLAIFIALGIVVASLALAVILFRRRRRTNRRAMGPETQGIVYPFTLGAGGFGAKAAPGAAEAAYKPRGASIASFGPGPAPLPTPTAQAFTRGGAGARDDTGSSEATARRSDGSAEGDGAGRSPGQLYGSAPQSNPFLAVTEKDAGESFPYTPRSADGEFPTRDELVSPRNSGQPVPPFSLSR